MRGARPGDGRAIAATGRAVKLPFGLLLVILIAALCGCDRQPAAQAMTVPTPTLAPQPTPSPALALGMRKQGIIFHDLTQSEQACPGLAEILAPPEVSPEQASDAPVEVVRQVRLVCTNDDTGTVYVVDLANQTITVTRKPPPVPGMP